MIEYSLWGLCAFAIAGLLFRPWQLPEALWTSLAALMVPLLGLCSWHDAGKAIASGKEVYLFLFGMMVLSEVARQEKLFDWLAASALLHAKGSGRRLFLLVFAVAIVTTAFLSNDATIILLTPPVIAVAQKARIDAFPSLLACAFVANAASFLLPISNPANLVLYGGEPPGLLPWLERFLVPSCLAVGVSFILLFALVRREIASRFTGACDLPSLDPIARFVALALFGVIVLLTLVSFLHGPLGWATALSGAGLGVVATMLRRQSPLPALREISWSVFPLVASLFVLVSAVEQSGVIQKLASLIVSYGNGATAILVTGFGLGLLSNVINNLPSGLLAAQLAPLLASHSPALQDALLIGVDLGPNLTLSGSLATVLWLIILRKHGLNISYARFMRYGVILTLPALAASLLVLML
ncbi:arsenic transporter [Asaia siamensis]|uniref:Arsenic transporter n=1 Tax=Asaia siamensis TaxID=110479 RepID=A0ABQ1LSM2_9PROT|nr:SLC13 family permease [Asaia siamensis]GBR03479.1 Na+/H+ antiporter NhaD [Asaia siamensis NRIC 0323]GGC29114.1 arsenic transporter [Asaia siamensis]